jgi:hypothetical protein
MRWVRGGRRFVLAGLGFSSLRVVPQNDNTRVGSEVAV